jgi:uncharacterized LabA/DUF88 family protein
MTSSRSKPGSQAFEKTYQRLLELLPPEDFAMLLDGALDSTHLHKLSGKLRLAAQGPKGFETPKSALVDKMGHLFHSDRAKAFTLTIALDRSTQHESSLVSSIEPQHISTRLGEHPAITLKRHGARLIWALVRDERAMIRSIEPTILSTYLQAARDFDHTHQRILDKGAGQEFRHIEKQARALSEQVISLEGTCTHLQQQHATTENHLKECRHEYQQLKEENKRLKTHKETAPKHTKPSLLSNHSHGEKQDKALVQLHEENSHLRQSINDLRERLATTQQTLKALHNAVPKPVVIPPEASLHKKDSPRRLRMGLFVDVANLAGAARRMYGTQANIDFARLLKATSGAQKATTLRAYAIDKGHGFKAFSHALQQLGFKVFGKKPKIFPDGTTKADWDIQITVDILSLGKDLDHVILASGDGDFEPLCAVLKKRNITLTAAVFGQRHSKRWVAAVDSVIELDSSILES